jgi:hypothetical protein
MKRSIFVALAFALCVSLAYAATEAVKPPVATDKQGIAAAVALTKITGIAISPMLGVGVVGAYDYFTCPKGEADKLPWFAQLKFWLPALLLVGVVAFKDAAGAALPPGWKKPLDIIETVENKISGLVAAGAVVPSIAAIFHSTLVTTSVEPHVMQAGILGVSFAPLLNILTIPVAIVCFVLVWMVGHVVNVLILISPWGAVDAALKSMRTAVIGFLTAVCFVSPKYSAILSLIIIVICYFIAGWSFRLMVFGSVFTRDFIFRRHKWFMPAVNANWMFTARPIEHAPIRTYGKLTKTEDGTLRFDYRPWLFLTPRSVPLPKGQYYVGRGLLFPEISMAEGEKTKVLLAMPPRYRTHEETVAQIYGISDIRDVGLLKGLKAIWNWLKGSTAQPAATPA